MRRKSVRVRYRVLQDHDGGQIPDYHEWYMPGGIEYYSKTAEPLGRSEDPWSWLVLECNNRECSGKAIVSLEGVLSVPLGTVHADPPGTIERWEQNTGRKWNV